MVKTILLLQRQLAPIADICGSERIDFDTQSHWNLTTAGNLNERSTGADSVTLASAANLRGST